MSNLHTRIAIATLVFGSNPSFECRLKVWCHGAQRVNREVFGGNASIVLLTTSVHDCKGAVSLKHDTELTSLSQRFAESHKTDGSMSGSTFRQANLLKKWQVFRLLEYDRVIFWDSDIDPYFPHSLPKDAQKARDHIVGMPRGVMYARGDHASPINSGVLVVRPNLTLYREGLAVLNRNLFNTTHGFDLAGPPRETMSANIVRFSHTACIKKNDWHFVCSDSDQGFFTHMMHVRNALRVEKPKFFANGHFWGWNKPFSVKGCTSYARHVRSVLSNDDSCLAMLKTDSSIRCYSMLNTPLL